MRCTRCGGLVLEQHGSFACVNCSHDPFLVLITVKCSTADCRMLPELFGYCATCWHSRKRSELSDAERSRKYRELMRGKQRARRAKAKELKREQSNTAQQEPCGQENDSLESLLRHA